MPERAMVHGTIDPDAIDAARKGHAPEPAPGMAGESGPSEPSRAEVLALRPDLADSVPGTPTDGDRDSNAVQPPASALATPVENSAAPQRRSSVPTSTGDAATDSRVDDVIDAVYARLDAVRHGVTSDIYVWSDGRVTGPPSGNEKGNGTLLTVVTPGAERPTRNALRQTIVAGLES